VFARQQICSTDVERAVGKVKEKARSAKVEVFFRELSHRDGRRGGGKGVVRRVGANAVGGAEKSRGRLATFSFPVLGPCRLKSFPS
jgi:hypothetical protein